MTLSAKQRRQVLHHRLKSKHRESPDAIGGDNSNGMAADASLDCGWGRLIFAHTYGSPERLAETLRSEQPERRDIALYARDPHVVLAQAPHELFLDPSHTFRLDLATYCPSRERLKSFFIRRLTTRSDAEAVNTIYASHDMVQVPEDFFWSRRDDRTLLIFVAEDNITGEILGTVMGVDHSRAFNDPEHGASLWCLAVAPQAPHPRVGEFLVRRLAEHFQTRGAGYMDLSVMHDNAQAIALYEKLGFRRIPAFAIKRKNVINEPLYTESDADDGLNPYAQIIVNEARRRGVSIEILDAEGGFFQLTYGGRSIVCRESLSEFTTAVAMSICDDKRVTRRVVEAAGVTTPAQLARDDENARARFLDEHGVVVVKPARGEQGRGVAAGIADAAEMECAVAAAREICPDVIVEACFEGVDLRLIVIDYKVVAAAVRQAPKVVGDGKSTVKRLIEKQSRRRTAATGGESAIPLDDETKRCVSAAGFSLDDVPDAGVEFAVRRTANLHTGGTIYDVTAETHPELIRAAITAARAIDIPVTGIDLMVRDHRQPDYVFIEANERPGLANHEPQPTAERFVDLLFPQSLPHAVREHQRKSLT